MENLSESEKANLLLADLFEKIYADMRKERVHHRGTLKKSFKGKVIDGDDLLKKVIVKSLEYGKYPELGVGGGMAGDKQQSEYWGKRNYKRNKKTKKIKHQAGSSKLHKRRRKYFYSINVAWFKNRLAERLIDSKFNNIEEILEKIPTLTEVTL